MNEPARETSSYAERHLRVGWWSLFIFLTLGAALETLHGLKVAWYLAPANETRRLLLTLAHAHGTLLGLVNIAFGVTARAMPDVAWGRFESRMLLAANVLLPGGFFLGGFAIYDGDPGLGVFVVPIGALALVLGALTVAVRLSRRRSSSPPGASS